MIVRPRWRRGYSNSVAAASTKTADVAEGGKQWDDALLRDIFDKSDVWHNFTQPSSAPHRGLFQNHDLTSPEGFRTYTSRTLEQTKKLVAQIESSHTEEDYRCIVRRLDLLSDLLCRVIDMSDFVRSTHPDPQIVAAAHEAYSRVYEYMNVLNTSTGLYQALKKAQGHPVSKSWSREEQAVARILMIDFEEKSGINLPPSARKRFVELSSEIAELGQKFVEDMAPEKQYISFSSARLKGMDPMVVRELTRFGKVTLPTVGMAASHALRTVEDEDVRKEVFHASQRAAKSQIKILEMLLQRRADLAGLLGAESYAHLALKDKMARTPEAVSTFLDALSEANKPTASAELAAMAMAKQKAGWDTELKPWDREFYTTRVLHNNRNRQKAGDELSAYFSLGTVFQGLSRLFTRLYGLRFVPVSPAPGETWNSQVRRLDVISETEGRIAVLYCDLFSRPGKNPNPAHFTIRCSRNIPIGDTDDGMPSNLDPSTGALSQLPTIALICNFASPNPRSSSPSLLSFREVQTLFHEMGHALHSFLGRTALHGVAGTRCQTDWAELPSVLSEHFARSPTVLSLFARHWQTDEPINPETILHKLSQESLFAATETRSQIVLAVADQRLHSTKLALTDSSSVFQSAVMDYSLIPMDREDAGTWHGFFGHLYGYGALYYAYLMDSVIAEEIWREVFKGREIDREAGERYAKEVLRWGGSRSGWESLAGVLGKDELKDGGEKAMRVVGEWGKGKIGSA
ncbi:zincin [Ascodesmis nigricans]|uniref:Mitochondrial intermediate peptidase n=1 Tax=Ascodesmis nigricans TaxID=341454 RepID=A0A4V3SJI2_9PEZI|nr:zincin [Ascodesmis nigricans]